MPAVSVIVPVYKNEQYLHMCINSILTQTFADFELILIDDGSPDNCPHICDEYAQADPRVIVIHKANQGVSAARNDGIVASCGTYITFVDSDDYVAENYLAALIEGAKNNVDFVCATKTVIYKDCQISDNGYFFKQDLTKKIEPVIYDKVSRYTSPWMKLFKREIIIEHNIWFNPTLHYGEDTAFVYEYLKHCTHITQIPDCVYFYRVYDGSAAHKFQKGISNCLAYRQSCFVTFINKLCFADPINDIIIDGFAYKGFRLLIQNVQYASKKDALQEISIGLTQFRPYIERLAKRIDNKEDISFLDIPEAFYREIAILANTRSAKRIYRYIVSITWKSKTFVIISAVKGKLFGKK